MVLDSLLDAMLETVRGTFLAAVHFSPNKELQDPVAPLYLCPKYIPMFPKMTQGNRRYEEAFCQKSSLFCTTSRPGTCESLRKRKTMVNALTEAAAGSVQGLVLRVGDHAETTG